LDASGLEKTAQDFDGEMEEIRIRDSPLVRADQNHLGLLYYCSPHG